MRDRSPESAEIAEKNPEIRLEVIRRRNRSQGTTDGLDHAVDVLRFLVVNVPELFAKPFPKIFGLINVETRFEKKVHGRSFLNFQSPMALEPLDHFFRDLGLLLGSELRVRLDQGLHVPADLIPLPVFREGDAVFDVDHVVLARAGYEEEKKCDEEKAIHRISMVIRTYLDSVSKPIPEIRGRNVT